MWCESVHQKVDQASCTPKHIMSPLGPFEEITKRKIQGSRGLASQRSHDAQLLVTIKIL
jgi:hypothetical protein